MGKLQQEESTEYCCDLIPVEWRKLHKHAQVYWHDALIKEKTNEKRKK